jgi:hypothetical protein
MRTKYISLTLLLAAGLLLFCFPGISQTKVYGFTYDDSGNRIKRQFIQLKSGQVNANNANSDEDVLIEDELNNRKIKIYPNPTHGKLRIEIPGSDHNSLPVYLHVYSSGGTIIIQRNIKDRINNLDLSNLPAGIYLLRIGIGDEHSEWKIIKE